MKILENCFLGSIVVLLFSLVILVVGGLGCAFIMALDDISSHAKDCKHEYYASSRPFSCYFFTERGE